MVKKSTEAKTEDKQKGGKKKIKNILISQPEPPAGNSPYKELEEKFKVKISFKPFIKVEGVSAKEFRKEKVEINDHSAVIFTSKTAIENFFRICDETRTEVPDDMKYFCVTEAIALYLQKFITYRKRKVFFPKTRDKTLEDYILKHKKEKFLFPRSNICQNNIPDFLESKGLDYTSVVLYKTLPDDLSDLNINEFDVICFFSPAGIQSLTDNFPDFEQGDTVMAAFGPSTCEEVNQKGFRLDIQAPAPQMPSMKMALEAYLKKSNK